MKQIPKKIFLQLGDDSESAETFKDIEGVSWSTERINETDIEYFRKKELPESHVPEFEYSLSNISENSIKKVDDSLKEAHIKEYLFEKYKFLSKYFKGGEEEFKQFFFAENTIKVHDVINLILNYCRGEDFYREG